MKVPYDPMSQVAPQGTPDVRAQVITNPGGAQAEARGVSQVGAGLDEMADQVARVARIAKRHADEIGATNAVTRWENGNTTLGYGTTAAPQSQPDATGASSGGPTAAPATPPTDTNAPHELPSGPPASVTAAISDPDSKLPQQGFFNTKGMDAAKYADPTLQAMGASQAEIAAGLPNDEQRQIFLEHSNQRLVDLRRQVIQHATQQQQVALEQSTSAAVESSFVAINNETTRAANADAAMTSVDTITQPVVDRINAMYRGQPDEAAQKVAGYKQEVALGLVQHYIAAKDATGAQKVLDARKDALAFGPRGARELEELQKTVSLLGAQQDGETAANELVANAKGKGDLYDMAQIADGAIQRGKGMSKEQFSAFDQAVGKWRGLAEDANKANGANHFNTALTALQNRWSINDISPTDATWLHENDPKGWQGILDEAARHERAQARGQKVEETPDQLRTFYEFKDSIGDLSPDELASAKPGSIISSAVKMGISLKRAGELSDYLLKLKHDPAAANTGLTPSQSDVIKDELISAGFGENHNGVMRIKSSALPLRTKLEQEVLKEQGTLRGASSGKDKKYMLDGDDLRKFLGPAIAPVVTETHWYKADDTKPAIETPGYKSQAVPQKDADQISEALKAAGEEVTPAKIRQVYESRSVAPAAAPSSGAAPAGGTVKIEDLAKDPTQASLLEPVARAAISRLSGKPGEPDFVPVQPRASLKPPARQKIVLPEIHLPGKAKRTESPLPDEDQQALDETASLTKNMGT